MVDLKESKKKLDMINQNHLYSKRRRGGRKQKTFDQEHRRVTLYFQNSVYEEVHCLRERGKISNLTEFVNKVIKKELRNKRK